ncbi:SDR family oxidoreductase [Mucilaginibacter boryungensis]|uniref:NAD(P)H-binding protein n=1 Tax=Mucilaginibacter boryungensis TaxID=768480 RepID=A0ABR9XMS9_9SPHI|nr:NAD(P)H-binding protein [Mucilaginibacter boryungensis]MBE9668596.1 NAD(P)H-binding protein [Mucilaginibacter boryungensis]
MKIPGNILITGGTGTLGREIIKQLSYPGQQITVITTQEDPGLPKEVNIVKGDLSHSQSIQDAVTNADIVIHCASNPLNAQIVDIDGTWNLLASINKEKLKHFIYISIAGIDKSDFPYYKVKYNVEQLVAEANVPFTILRATQFYEFVLNRMIKPYDTGKSLTIPAGLKFQAIDISEVAGKIAGLMESTPKNETITIGGPAVQTIEEMAQAYLDVQNRKDELKTEQLSGARFDMLRSGINVCPENAFGTKTWQQFLNKHANDLL